ncbi:MAG: hypothetical protein ACXWUG_00600 [Polyangiales bacterium]
METFVDVDVEPGPASADGVMMRFKLASPLTDIREIEHETDDGLAGTFAVFAVDDPAAELRTPARAARVEDSSDGIALLVVGGRHGLLLVHERGIAREPYLLLTRDAVFR